MFEGDFADTYSKQFQFKLIGGRVIYLISFLLQWSTKNIEINSHLLQHIYSMGVQKSHDFEYELACKLNPIPL